MRGRLCHPLCGVLRELRHGLRCAVGAAIKRRERLANAGFMARVMSRLNEFEHGSKTELAVARIAHVSVRFSRFARPLGEWQVP